MLSSLTRFHQHFGKFNLFCIRFSSSKVPERPVSTEKSHSIAPIIDEETILHLERLSLVDFGDEKGVRILEDAIKFAEQLSSVDTDGVEPLISVLEKSHLRLRDDIVTDGHMRKEVLSNAKVIEEDYFVAPPGNIPADPFHASAASDNDQSTLKVKKAE